MSSAARIACPTARSLAGGAIGGHQSGLGQVRSLCDAPIVEQSLEPRVSLANVMQLARQGQVTHQLRWNAALGSEVASPFADICQMLCERDRCPVNELVSGSASTPVSPQSVALFWSRPVGRLFWDVTK